MFKVNYKDTSKDAIGVVLVSLLLILNIFHTLLFLLLTLSRSMPIPEEFSITNFMYF